MRRSLRMNPHLLDIVQADFVYLAPAGRYYLGQLRQTPSNLLRWQEHKEDPGRPYLINEYDCLFRPTKSIIGSSEPFVLSVTRSAPSDATFISIHLLPNHRISRKYNQLMPIPDSESYRQEGPVPLSNVVCL